MVKKIASKKKSAPAKVSKKNIPCNEKESHAEFSFDPVEKEAIRLVRRSNPFCDELAVDMTKAASKVVKAAFKKRKINLTAVQAKNLAAYLFGN